MKLSIIRGNFLLALMLFLSAITFSQSEIAVNHESKFADTYGTFHFEFQDGVRRVLQLQEVEALYSGIEARRQENTTFYWHINPNTTVVIYSKEAIVGEFFVKMSPFERIKTPE